MSLVVSACAIPLGVSSEKSLLPWMRPSAFHVLWPCRTSTTRLRVVMLGSRSGASSCMGPPQQQQEQEQEPRQPAEAAAVAVGSDGVLYADVSQAAGC